MLQALLRQRIPQDRVVAADLLQTLAHLAHALKREVGVYVDRHGTVREVVVSRRWQELLPTLTARASATRLIGLRYIAARPEAESAPAEGDRRHVIEARLDPPPILRARGRGAPAARRIKAVEGALRRSPRVITAGVRPERAVLVALSLSTDGTKPRAVPDLPIGASLEELSRLAETAGAEVCARITQARSKRDPATFIGKGQVGGRLRP